MCLQLVHDDAPRGDAGKDLARWVHAGDPPQEHGALQEGTDGARKDTRRSGGEMGVRFNEFVCVCVKNVNSHRQERA